MQNSIFDTEPHIRRILPAEGICNIRELGGYPVAGERGAARRIKWGLLYRSAALQDMTGNDLGMLGERGIRTIVDFRAPGEKILPDVLPSSVRRRELFPINAGNLMAMVPTAEGAEVEMRRLYRALPDEAAHYYQRFFAILARRENAPVLFHCSMGKDRTGLAAVLILYALGADMDTIFSDYLESDTQIRARKVASFAANPDMAPYMTVQRNYLESALARIDELGGLDRYVRDRLRADIPRLRTHYTE